MNLEIKDIWSSDVDLFGFAPGKDDSYCFIVQVNIGPDDEDRSDTFQFLVVSLQWLIEKVNFEGAAWASKMLVVRQFSVDLVQESIVRLFEGIVGDNWEDAAARIGEQLKWEFCEYR